MQITFPPCGYYKAVDGEGWQSTGTTGWLSLDMTWLHTNWPVYDLTVDGSMYTHCVAVCSAVFFLWRYMPVWCTVVFLFPKQSTGVQLLALPPTTERLSAGDSNSRSVGWPSCPTGWWLMTTWSTGHLAYFLVVGWQLAADNLVCTATADW